jgi:hypothetical protein
MISKFSKMAFLVAPFLAGCATTGGSSVGPGGETIFTRTITVASGASTEVTFATALNPDCSRLHGTVIRLVTPPAHGRFSTAPSTGFTTFSPPNPRAKCNGRRVSGITLRYVSERGFVGDDQFVYDHFPAAGGLWRVTVNVQVR